MTRLFWATVNKTWCMCFDLHHSWLLILLLFFCSPFFRLLFSVVVFSFFFFCSSPLAAIFLFSFSISFPFSAQMWIWWQQQLNWFTSTAGNCTNLYSLTNTDTNQKFTEMRKKRVKKKAKHTNAELKVATTTKMKIKQQPKMCTIFRVLNMQYTQQ